MVLPAHAMNGSMLEFDVQFSYAVFEFCLFHLLASFVVVALSDFGCKYIVICTMWLSDLK